jgi:hypothetical protein
MGSELTTRVVASSQKDTSGSLAQTDDMTGSRGGKNAVLADDELLDTVGGTNLGNKLDNLGVPVSAVATDNKKRAYQLIRSWLVLQSNWLHTLNSFGNRKQDAGDEGLAVVRLLKDSDLFAKAGAIDMSQWRFYQMITLRL